MTGLESTYLTAIDWHRQVQRIVVAHNAGGLDIAEGLEVPWEDTLCRRAMDADRFATIDVPATWGDSVVARELGTSRASGPPRPIGCCVHARSSSPRPSTG